MVDRSIFSQTPALLGVSILLLDLATVYYTLTSGRSVPYKLGWSLTVLLFPVGGLLLYLPFVAIYAWGQWSDTATSLAAAAAKVHDASSPAAQLY